MRSVGERATCIRIVIPPRRRIRFDEFVRATDAARFGPGGRTRRWIDWPRIIVWSALGAITAAVVVGIAVMAVLL